MIETIWVAPSNFSIMTVCVCAIVTLNVYFAEYFINRRNSTDSNGKEQNLKIIDFPGFFQTILWSKSDEDSNNNSKYLKDTTTTTNNKNDRWSYIKFSIMNLFYFLIMFMIITVLHQYPSFLLVIQHISVFLVITLNFLQFGKALHTIPLSIVYGSIWFMSLNTEYRWILNNTIVFMCILLTGYIRFRNFIYLQIFMWLAFFYDVYMLYGIQIDGIQFFSIREELTAAASSVMTATGGGGVVQQSCQTMLCHLFSHDNNFKIPTAFSVQLGAEIDHVYIGTGDIMIGSFVTNFAFRFFEKTNYMVFTVFTFGGAVGMLSYVTTNAPFPALLTIVPVCTMSLVFLALWSSRSHELIVGCKNKDRSAYRKSKSIDSRLIV